MTQYFYDFLEKNIKKYFSIRLLSLHQSCAPTHIYNVAMANVIDKFWLNNIFFVFFADYVAGGELFTHLYQREHFKEHEVRIYIGEIILALEHLHSVSVLNTNYSKFKTVLSVIYAPQLVTHVPRARTEWKSDHTNFPIPLFTHPSDEF